MLADHLAIGLVYDLPDSMRTIVQQDLENWGVTFYEALEAACANLRQKEDPVFISPHDGVYISATGDNYDASRLILTDMVHQFDVQGELIAMVPNRDTLIITGSDDLSGLTIMAARAKQALQEPRPISMFAFRLVDDDWTEWRPAADHPLHQQFALLRLQSLGQQYAEQKELLERTINRRGRPFRGDFLRHSQPRIRRREKLLRLVGRRRFAFAEDRPGLFFPRGWREGGGFDPGHAANGRPQNKPSSHYLNYKTCIRRAIACDRFHPPISFARCKPSHENRHRSIRNSLDGSATPCRDRFNVAFRVVG